MKRKKWLALPLVLLLVALTGCQAVGGFDINKAVLGGLKPTANESRQTLSVELVPAGNATQATKEIIDIINSLTLTVDSAKVQDTKNVSVKGSIGYQDSKIPFLMSMDGKSVTLQVEGAKQPLYEKLDTEVPGLSDMDKYQENVRNVMFKAAELVMKHMPNPSVVSVKQVQDKINGESLGLTDLHAEIRGDELIGLIKPFLGNLSKDEQGLKELIGVCYDTFYPIISAYNGMEEDQAVSKDAVVVELYNELKKGIDEVLSSYDKLAADMLAQTPELSTLLGKDSTLKMDAYFDSKLNMRKQIMDINLAVPASEQLPIKSFKLHSESEIWNIGGTVTADKVDTTAGVLDVTDEGLTPGRILRNYEAVPELNTLLRDLFQISHKHFVMDSHSDYYSIITKDNTTFVPLRYLAEQLDAPIKWTKGSKQIVIIDDITGSRIVVTVGSKKATVGGKQVTLKQPVFVHKDGTTYVPLRFIAEALGAKVNMDVNGWITVERP